MQNYWKSAVEHKVSTSPSKYVHNYTGIEFMKYGCT